MKSRITFFALLGLSISLFAFTEKTDDTKELIHILTSSYYTDHPLIYDMTMSQYDSTGTKLLNQMDGGIISSRNMYKLHYGNIEIIVQDSLMLQVHHELKRLDISKVRKGQRDSILGLGATTVISQIKRNDISIQKLGSQGAIDIYEFSFPNTNRGVYKLHLNTKTGFIDEINMFYYDTDENFEIKLFKMRIQYSNYRKVMAYNLLKKYFDFQAHGYRVKEQYKHYTGINFNEIKR